MSSTLAIYRTKLDQRLTNAGVTNFFTQAIKDEFINAAGRRVSGWAKWPFLNHAIKFQTEAGQEWYELPARFKTASIQRATIKEGPLATDTDVEYDLESWNEYEELKERETARTIATVLGTQVFFYPVPFYAGYEATVFGQLRWIELTGADMVSIMPVEFDEAIIKLALSMALRKERRQADANVEINEVEDPRVGLLVRLEGQMVNQKPAGYVGRARSSRFEDV